MARNERQMLLPKARRRLDTGSEVDMEMGYQGFSSNWLTPNFFCPFGCCLSGRGLCPNLLDNPGKL